MSLTFVSEQLLATNKLSHQDLYKVLGQLAERRIDYADLYFQSSYHEAWVIEDGIIRMALTISTRASACAPSAAKTGFAYADQITLNALQQSAQAARSIVREQGDGRAHTLGEIGYRPLYPLLDPLQSLPREEKLLCCTASTRWRAPPMHGCRK